jgi:hypothetical protein
VEKLSTKNVDKPKSLPSIFSLWKVWITFPQKMWKSRVHQSFTQTNVDNSPPGKDVCHNFAHFTKLFHNFDRSIHRQTFKKWGKIPIALSTACGKCG